MAVRPTDVSVENIGTLNATDAIPIDRIGVDAKRKTTPADITIYVNANHNHLEQTIKPDVVELQTTPATPTAIGSLFYNQAERTMSFILDDGGSAELGKEMFDHYTVLEAGGIVNGDIVSVVGASGNRSAVSLTDVTDPHKSLSTIGMCTVPSILNNNIGRITTRGHVHELNTLGYIEGDPIYVDPVNKGKWVQNKPASPTRAIQIGIVVVAHSTQGVVDVDVKVYPNHNELNDLQGGTTAEYYHLTAAQHNRLDSDLWYHGSADPTAVDPQYAVVGDYYLKSDGSLWEKTDTVDPAWAVKEVNLNRKYIPTNNTQNITDAGQLAAFTLGLGGDPENPLSDPTWNSGVNYVTKIFDASESTALSMKTDSNDGVPFMVSNLSGVAITLTPLSGTINDLATLDLPNNEWITIVFNNGNACIVDSTDPTLVCGYVPSIPKQYATDNNVPSGFIDHTTSIISLSAGVDTFTVYVSAADEEAGFPVYINGTLHAKNTQSIVATDTYAVLDSKRYFIYYAPDGTLSISDTAWNLESEDYDGSAPICTVLWDTTGNAGNGQGILEEERHHSWRDIHWHHWAHHTVGPQYSAAHYADAFTLTYPSVSTFKMTEGSMYDEDVRNDSVAPVADLSKCNLFYYSSASTMTWIEDHPSLYYAPAGVPQYDDRSGTLRAKTNSDSLGYFVSWVYATNGTNTGDLSNPKDIAVIIGQDTWTTGDPAGTNGDMTLTEAQNVAMPTLPNRFILEWKLLYKVIFRYRQTGTIERVSTTDYRIAGSIPSGQAPTSNVSAGSVSFAPTTEITATNVQAALESVLPRFALYREASTTITLAQTDNGYIVIYTGSGAVNCNIPAVSGITDGTQIQVWNQASAAVDLTFVANGSEYKATDGSKLAQYKSALLVKRGSFWYAAGGLS